MITPQSLAFQNERYLLLLISLPLIIITHFFVLNYLNRRAVKFANFEAIRRVTGGRFDIRNARIISKNKLLLLVRVLVLTCLILALSEPVAMYIGHRTGSDFVIAIDASSSMLATDLAPYRLDAARQTSLEFIDSLESKTSIGVVSFAGTSTVDQGMTDDKETAREVVSGIRVKSSGGTDLGGAIMTATNLLIPSTNPRVIVLLTDGQSTVGVPVEEAIDYANKNKVIIHTIGIGTTAGGSFVKSDLLSRLDEDTLKSIAEESGGTYYRAENEAALRNAFIDISALAEEKISLRLATGLVMIALILLFIEWGMINTKYRALP